MTKFLMPSILLLTALLMTSSCSSPTFEDQIINDIKTKIPSGICDEFPKGTELSNIKVGEIVDIGLRGMTDVSYEFDYKIDGETKHKSSAMLYIKSGSKYRLASLGSDCDFGPE